VKPSQWLTHLFLIAVHLSQHQWVNRLLGFHEFRYGSYEEKLWSKSPVCGNWLRNCKNFIVRSIVPWSIGYFKPIKKLLYLSNTTNDSRNTKLQNYKQQSLPVQISVLLQLLILWNVKIYTNTNIQERLCDHNINTEANSHNRSWSRIDVCTEE